MAEITFNIDISITDGELKQMYKELGDAMPTDENITATPTFRRIWDRVYVKMVETDEKNKKNAEAKEADT